MADKELKRLIHPCRTVLLQKYTCRLLFARETAQDVSFEGRICVEAVP